MVPGNILYKYFTFLSFCLTPSFPFPASPLFFASCLVIVKNLSQTCCSVTCRNNSLILPIACCKRFKQYVPKYHMRLLGCHRTSIRGWTLDLQVGLGSFWVSSRSCACSVHCGFESLSANYLMIAYYLCLFLSVYNLFLLPDSCLTG